MSLSFKLTCLTCALSVGLSQSTYAQRLFELMLRANREDAWSMMAKLSREHAERHADELSRCLKMSKALSVSKCSLTRVLKVIEMSGGLTDIAGCTLFYYYYLLLYKSERDDHVAKKAYMAYFTTRSKQLSTLQFGFHFGLYPLSCRCSVKLST